MLVYTCASLGEAKGLVKQKKGAAMRKMLVAFALLASLGVSGCFGAINEAHTALLCKNTKVTSLNAQWYKEVCLGEGAAAQPATFPPAKK